MILFTGAVKLISVKQIYEIKFPFPEIEVQKKSLIISIPVNKNLLTIRI